MHARLSDATCSDIICLTGCRRERRGTTVYTTETEYAKLTQAKVAAPCAPCIVSWWNSCQILSEHFLSAFILSQLLFIHTSVRSTHEMKSCTVSDADAGRHTTACHQHIRLSVESCTGSTLNNLAVYHTNSNYLLHIANLCASVNILSLSLNANHFNIQLLITIKNNSWFSRPCVGTNY